jgi:hypothetical protein
VRVGFTPGFAVIVHVKGRLQVLRVVLVGELQKVDRVGLLQLTIFKLKIQI